VLCGAGAALLPQHSLNGPVARPTVGNRAYPFDEIDKRTCDELLGVSGSE
jgi:hypothetical protein